MKGGEEGGGDEETGRQREMAQSAERRAQAICTFMSLVEADMFVKQILNIHIFVSFKLVIT